MKPLTLLWHKHVKRGLPCDHALDSSGKAGRSFGTQKRMHPKGHIHLIKNSGPISRVLYSPRRALAIYPGRSSRHASIVLPTSSGGPPSLTHTPSKGCSRCNAGLRELSASGVHSTHVAMRLVGSYPTFSPLPPTATTSYDSWPHRRHNDGGGSFLLHVLALADFYPLGSRVPYAARTFLSPQLESIGQRQAGPLSIFIVPTNGATMTWAPDGRDSSPVSTPVPMSYAHESSCRWCPNQASRPHCGRQ